MSTGVLLYFRLKNAVSAALFRICFGHLFKHFGKGARVVFPRAIVGASNISLGDNVFIAPGTLLAAEPLTRSHACLLEIGSGTSIGNYNQIYATERISIGRNVLTANNVYISDNGHGYADVSTPIKQQPIVQKRPVDIGDGTWLGQNACVVGASIGKNCVVGANAVVTRDIPDYSVAAGAPAVIVKRYDPATNTWKSTAPDGAFLD